MSSSKLGFVKSVAALLPFLAAGALEGYRQHYALPTPLTDLHDPTTGRPQISEANIRDLTRQLADDIGYRTVGTYEHAMGDAWVLNQAEEVKKRCEELVQLSGGHRKLECEVWHQSGTGSHRFDIMRTRLYKSYVNLTNTVIRISDGTDAGKENAVLVNAHVDSTLPGPGAADDALAVGIMFDVARVLIETPEWKPESAIVLLFNNAEESLQDGSHLFSTQHPIANTVRAVINLEAAGTNGREILFQATSEQMIEAYSHVPRPFGTIFANDIFSTNILQSDTDFRQFQLYLNVTGLDMALIGNGYLYHMRKDITDNIQAGSAQNMAENTLALLLYLSGPESPIASLTQGYTPPTTVFYSYLGRFWLYSFQTANIVHATLFSAALLLTALTGPRFASLLKGVGYSLAGLVGALVGANGVAFVMKGMDKTLSWYTDEWLAPGLYLPPALLGVVVSQSLLPPIPEEAMLYSVLLMQSGAALVIQLLGVGSAALLFLEAWPLLVILAGWKALSGKGKAVPILVYGLGQFFPVMMGLLLYFPVTEVFIPLMGRIGKEAPAENVVATLVTFIASMNFPLLVAFVQRHLHVSGAKKGAKQSNRGKAIITLTALSAACVAYYASKEPFDEMHQRRMFVLRTENITSGEHILQVAPSTDAPGFDQLVKDIATDFLGHSAESVVEVKMNDYNADWDPLYPFSNALSPFKYESLVVPEAYVSPYSTFNVAAVDESRDLEKKTRTLTLRITHPGLIWTVIAFDAHVLSWDLDDSPLDYHVRHHIKEASFFGEDTWQLHMTVYEENGPAPILVNFIGLQEQGMWPGKKESRGLKGEGNLEGMLALDLFGRFDAWLEERTGGTVDATLLGAAAGAVSI